MAAKIKEELLPHVSSPAVAELLSLSFSTGWMCKFQKCHKLTLKRVHGEVALTKSISVINKKDAGIKSK
uniref:AlNc14C203G8743 protein n=1 Tax=Albugo laibachii Nc14 TaxID=890382 RepID=F0W7W5_9STRA|nr:AlNc14C32G2915 [Albugo laibachii Nc14]CCA23693.1 AlNc14C203G8743 [Albugo laibachii Nc14]|eukprot:CCA23693.1 AlNc14C203G8743 [Albugo laibachii Nc14]